MACSRWYVPAAVLYLYFGFALYERQTEIQKKIKYGSAPATELKPYTKYAKDIKQTIRLQESSHEARCKGHIV